MTAFSVYSVITRLEVKTDFFELYPPKHEYIKLYKEFRGMFGSANMLTIILERKGDGDIYNPETLKKVNELTLGVLSIKGCNPLQVNSISHPRVKQAVLNYQGIGLFPLMWPKVPETPAECEKFKKVVYSNEGIRGFYISLDDRSTVIYAGFWEEGVDLSYLFKEVTKLTASIEDENHKCYVAGYPMLYAWVSHYRGQIYLILTVTAAAMILLLIIYFRRAGGVLIPAISGIISAIWGLGFAAALGINIDPLLLVVPILLSARALSHSCQCLERFHQEFLECRDKEKAIVTAYSALYPPALLAIMTDGLGVLTISIATIPLMQKLAYFSSFWIISIFIAVVILNPVIISFFYSSSPEDNRLRAKEKELSVLTKKNAYAIFTNLIYRLSGQRAKWGVAVVVVVLLFGGGFVTTRYLKVGDSSAGGAVLYSDHPYNIAMQKMNTDFVGASRLIVVLEGKEREAIKDRDSLKIMEDLQSFMLHNIENVGGTLSLADLVRKIYRMYHEGNPKWDMIPQSKRDLGQIFWVLSASMAPGEMDQFVSLPDYTNSNVTAFLRKYSHDSIKSAIEKLKEFGEIVNSDTESKIQVRVAAGILGILAAVNEEVEWSYWAILVVIFSTTFILCSFTYRSFKAAFILLIPLAVSQVLCELIMLLFHIDLNIDSLPVTAIGVGIGIDYGIYLMSRLREECYVQNDFDKARLMALITTGKVIMFTALTMAIGVGFWVFSVMKFPAEMGLLILLLMIFNMISALVLIPALSGIFRPAFVKNIGKEVAA
jgi:predicted RND superfamily exporter protein